MFGNIHDLSSLTWKPFEYRATSSYQYIITPVSWKLNELMPSYRKILVYVGSLKEEKTSLRLFQKAAGESRALRSRFSRRAMAAMEAASAMVATMAYSHWRPIESMIKPELKLVTIDTQMSPKTWKLWSSVSTCGCTFIFCTVIPSMATADARMSIQRAHGVSRDQPRGVFFFQIATQQSAILNRGHGGHGEGAHTIVPYDRVHSGPHAQGEYGVAHCVRNRRDQSVRGGANRAPQDQVRLEVISK